MPKQTFPENSLPSDIPFGWWPCFNVTAETIPGYAHVKYSRTRHDPNDEDELEFINRGVERLNWAHSLELVAGQAVIRVRKPLPNPLDTAPGSLDSDMVQLGFFTWHHPILPHQFGLCTRLPQRRALVYATPAADGNGWAYRVPHKAPLAVNPDNPWTLIEEDGDTTQWVCLFMDPTDRRSRQSAESSTAEPAPTVCWIEAAGSGE